MRARVALGVLFWFGSAAAVERTPQPLATGQLAALASTLESGDLGLIESYPDGTMKQVTLLTLVHAPAALVHDLLAHPGGYPSFIGNLKKSTEEPQADGSIRNVWELSLPMSSFAGINRFSFEPGPTGAVLQQAIEDGSEAIYRWEFVPVEAGCILVQHGYTDVKSSNRLVKSFLKRQPVMEHGLALSAQLMAVWSFRKEAQKRAGAQPAGKASAPKLSLLDFLFARGQVVYMQSKPDGTLGDVSLFDRVYAPAQTVLSAIDKPGEYQNFIPGVPSCSERARDAITTTYRMEIAVPMVTWVSTYLMRKLPTGYEGIGADGDLRGARYRWDVHSRGDREALLVYRVFLPLAQSSLLARKLFQVQPSLEHGLNVALGLVFLRSMRAKAEGWK